MGNRARGSVSAAIDVRLVVSGEHRLAVPVDLRYDPSDPYAVHATFHAGDNAVEWVFARSLLADGMYRPSGEGDVRVWPGGLGGQAVLIALTSPDGAALVEAPRAALAAFVARTYAVVPGGTEGSHLDLDRAIGRLLADA
ncbi:MAG: SsgA family sporulation/cell division regulator [Actinomycetota bacterium]